MFPKVTFTRFVCLGVFLALSSLVLTAYLYHNPAILAWMKERGIPNSALAALPTVVIVVWLSVTWLGVRFRCLEYDGEALPCANAYPDLNNEAFWRLTETRK
jgi:hypothetical protein